MQLTQQNETDPQTPAFAPLPVVTVMIATYNSAQLLARTLRAVRAQDYPADRLEILIVDGGSTDATREIAAQYGCRVLDNPKTEPVNAKLIGLREAKGTFYVTIDHDEVLVNPASLRRKVEALLENPRCHVALCSGYQRPPEYPGINEYISEFGDPYSLFLYHFSKGYRLQQKTLRACCEVVREEQDYWVVDFQHPKRPPIYELVCLGTMIDRAYFCKAVPALTTDPAEVVHLFYHMLALGVTQMVFLTQDPLLHYSADSLKAYFPKLKWRVCNNVHFAEKGALGVTGRMQYQQSLQWKKYVFLPYALTLLVPLAEGAVMACRRRNAAFLLHPLLSFYVAWEILWQYARKLLGCPPAFRSYDGKKKIDR